MVIERSVESKDRRGAQRGRWTSPHARTNEHVKSFRAISLGATSIGDRCSMPEYGNVRLPEVSRLEWAQLTVIIVFLWDTLLPVLLPMVVDSDSCPEKSGSICAINRTCDHGSWKRRRRKLDTSDCWAGYLTGYPIGVKIERATRCGRAVREHHSFRSVRTSKACLARARLLRGAVATPQTPCASHCDPYRR